MRDIAITAFVLGLLPFILRQPVLGIHAWVWLSMMNPHRGSFGFARSFPFAMMVALTTLTALMFSKHRRPLPLNLTTAALLMLLFWMTFTSVFAIAPPGIVQERWIFVMKTQLMLLAALMLVRGRVQIDRLIWVISGSIGFYGIKGGIFTLATGGSGRVWGPADSLLEGNNE